MTHEIKKLFIGKVLNVREATHKQILENAEINNLIKILGLQYKKKYETREDLKTLRYGKMMIMTDQDAVIFTVSSKQFHIPINILWTLNKRIRI